MYCLNPTCPKPNNPESAKFCQACGVRLRLGDRYRAYQIMGGGGSSRTFLGLDTRKLFDPRCVIKRFINREEEERFRQEAARLDELSQHPQIPDLWAYFERDRAQYLVQEFVDGRNLLQEITESGSFDEAQIRELLSDLLPLLHFLHSHQIVHRDLKPSNLIRRSISNTPSLNPDDEPTLVQAWTGDDLTHQKSRGDLVLVDFGAAKRVTESGIHKQGTVIGSAEYAAPEQLMGMATFASDLYSLGVTCIHLLTGLRPFDLFDSQQGVWRWRVVAGEVSDALTRVLDRMLAMNCSDRYPSASEIMSDLGLPLPKPAPKPDLKWKKREEPWQCSLVLQAETGINAIAPTPNAKMLISGGNNGTVTLWDLDRGEVLWQFEGHQQVVTALAVSTDGEWIASSSLDGTVKIWQLMQGKLLHTLRGHTAGVTAVALSSDGTLLVSGSRDMTMRLWHPETGQSLGVLTSHRGTVEAIALDTPNQTLASGGAEGAVKIWHIGTRELLRTLSGHAGQVSAIALTPDNQTVISGSWDMTLKLRNLHAGGLRHNLPGHLLPITSVALSPDAQRLATGSHDCTVKLWSVTEGRLLHTLTGHTAAVEAVAFLEAGAIASASQDGTVRVWHCTNPDPQML